MIKGPARRWGRAMPRTCSSTVRSAVILGGRLGYSIFCEPRLCTSFASDSWLSWKLLRLWDGGMSFHGGVLGVLVAIAWVAVGGHFASCGCAITSRSMFRSG